MFKIRQILLTICTFSILVINAQNQPLKILNFSGDNGYQHTSMPEAQATIEVGLGDQNVGDYQSIVYYYYYLVQLIKFYTTF